LRTRSQIPTARLPVTRPGAKCIPSARLARSEGPPRRWLVIAAWCDLSSQDLTPSYDELVDKLLEDGERDGTVGEHGGVELGEVEGRAERLTRSVAQLEDLDQAHRVRHGLAGCGDVPLDLVAHGVLRQSRRLHHVVHRLLGCPSPRVDSRVDDETCRAEELLLEAAEIAVGVTSVCAKFPSQSFRVQRPALGEGGERDAAEELRQVGLLRGGGL